MTLSEKLKKILDDSNVKYKDVLDFSFCEVDIYNNILSIYTSISNVKYDHEHIFIRYLNYIKEFAKNNLKEIIDKYGFVDGYMLEGIIKLSICISPPNYNYLIKTEFEKHHRVEESEDKIIYLFSSILKYIEEKEKN